MEDCKCKNKCFVAISEAERNKIRKIYQSLRTYREKCSYLHDLIEINREGSDDCNLTSTFSYFVKAKKSRVNVCQKAFIAIHNITISTLKKVIKQMNHLHPSDEKPKTSKLKINSCTKTKVQKHILSTLNKETVAKWVAEGGKLNVTKMWEDYKFMVDEKKLAAATLRLNENENVCDDGASEQDFKIVSKYTYTSIFNEIFPTFLEKLNSLPFACNEKLETFSKGESSERVPSVAESSTNSNAVTRVDIENAVPRPKRLFVVKKSRNRSALNHLNSTSATVAPITISVLRPKIEPVELVYFF